ncbi:DJ-1/PfpI family protein [Sphingomonas sp. G-3-2-10]|uniref:DJ-1/PfpI family protein n=1 Tax=Sphingomonas sp. G-3-2-10 TaxID=2728838 RepID=UPI00146D03C8|nr:DJ-1/PfpI family protein [Sphingomonas sp. G-3-2-10]NML08450.1 DJ-1/PfpI family protein [Sphingomonas sp. G-3-2-10]
MESQPFTVGMIAFDMMTNLDFVGPFDILSRVRGARTILLGKALDPIVTDSRYRLLPEMRLAEAPELDMIFVPGGPGSTKLMEDPEVLAFLAARAPRAKWVTSVCTGALVLGAAGLLKGYRAATHWSAMDILPVLGAIPVHERVVIDRNRVTGGGVTAGIDFALTLIAQIWGEDQAKLIQLGNEYNPQPPFDAGSPERAPDVAARYRELTRGMTAARMEAAQRAAARLR